MRKIIALAHTLIALALLNSIKKLCPLYNIQRSMKTRVKRRHVTKNTKIQQKYLHWPALHIFNLNIKNNNMTETQRHKIIIQRKNIKKHDVNIFVWTP